MRCRRPLQYHKGTALPIQAHLPPVFEQVSESGEETLSGPSLPSTPSNEDFLDGLAEMFQEMQLTVNIEMFQGPSALLEGGQSNDPTEDRPLPPWVDGARDCITHLTLRLMGTEYSPEL